MKFLKTWIFCTLALLTTLTYSDDAGSGLIYGEDYTYSLSAPTGWTLDNTSGVNQGLVAVFYPQGGSWQNSTTVMYTTVSHYNKADQRNTEQVMEYDIKAFKTYPEIKVEKKKPITTADKKRKGSVIHFLKDARGNYEAVAYIAEKKLAVLITYSARTEKDFLEKYSAFEDLVKSYVWMGNIKVDIKK